MNWIILIVAGFFESGFAFCLGKMKEVSGTEWYGAVGTVVMGIVFFHEPTSFLRLFFISTLIISIVGLKVVSA